MRRHRKDTKTHYIWLLLNADPPFAQYEIDGLAEAEDISPNHLRSIISKLKKRRRVWYPKSRLWRIVSAK